MNKKKTVFISIVFVLMMISIAIPVTGQTSYDERILGRTRIRAIGSFHICKEDEVVYGRIIIGIEGLKPVFFKDIQIDMDDLVWIFMTDHILRCVIR